MSEQQKQLMYIKRQLFCLHLDCLVIFRHPVTRNIKWGNNSLGSIESRVADGNWYLVLRKVSDMLPKDEAILNEFAQQAADDLTTSSDFEAEIWGMSLMVNKLRSLGYDCDGLIEKGIAVNVREVEELLKNN